MSKKTDLCWVLESGDINKAREMIENYVGFDELISDSYLLGSAVLSNDIESVRYVLNLGVDVDLEANEDGWTPILIAASTGYIKIFKLLVDKGANINFISDQGDTAINLAKGEGFTEIVNYLNTHPSFDRESNESESDEIVERIYSIQNSNKYDERTSEIVIATMQRDFKTLNKLINSGFNLNKINKFARSPLIAAVGNADIEMIRFLLDFGADPNFCQPLLSAVGFRDTQVMDVLLEAGAKINGRDDRGITALMVAVTFHPMVVDVCATVEFLIKNGADINIRDKNGLSVVEHAKKAGNGQHFRLMKLLKEAGAEGID